MTRDFNNQRRDDTRPSSRRPSAGKFGEERPSFPGRPRLNRETVDRAWESGAQHSHADYRPRTNGGQPPRNNRYNNQQPPERPAFPNERNNNRPYDRRPNQDNHYQDNRREPYKENQRDHDYRAPRRFEQTPDGERGPRPQPFQGNRRDFPNQGERRPYGQGNFSDRGERRPYGPRDSSDRGEHRPYGQRDSSDRGERRPYAPRDSSDRGERRPYGQRDSSNDGQSRDRFSRPGGYEDRGRPRQDGPGNQHNDRPRNFDRNDRPGDANRPRWQERPTDRRNDTPFEPRDGARRQGPPNAQHNQRPQPQFEGDYEHLAGNDARPHGRRNDARTPEDSPVHRPFQGHQDNRRNAAFKGQENSASEPYVTRLPDGRVLKGSRPSQRKQAQFWQGVSQDTNEIVGAVRSPEVEQPDAVDAPSTGTEETETTSEDPQDATPKKRRKHLASAVTRGKKGTTGGRSGPKPSQRGFKWPAP